MEINIIPNNENEGKGIAYEITLNQEDIDNLDKGPDYILPFLSAKAQNGLKINLVKDKMSDSLFGKNPSFQSLPDATGIFIEIGTPGFLANDDPDKIKELFEEVGKIPIKTKVPELGTKESKDIVVGHVVFKVNLKNEIKEEMPKLHI
ncbi:MAG: hypothetical protein WC356_04415 [Candidatus Micrarchaeia archaeon]|jgi:hypothetical protein